MFSINMFALHQSNMLPHCYIRMECEIMQNNEHDTHSYFQAYRTFNSVSFCSSNCLLYFNLSKKNNLIAIFGSKNSRSKPALSFSYAEFFEKEIFSHRILLLLLLFFLLLLSFFCEKLRRNNSTFFYIYIYIKSSIIEYFFFVEP